jgi:transposase-like protein
MPRCKNCSSEHAIKNGKARGKQRYRCKECGLNFVEGDERTNEKIAAKKAMLVLFYSLGKASFNMLGKLFDTRPSQVYRWVVQEGLSLPEQEISGEIREMEFDEMWHFVREKKTSFVSLRPLIVAQGTPRPGCPAIVILQHLALSIYLYIYL